MQHSHLDKDEPLKTTGELIKQQHNDDLKKIIADLERQLQFEQERNRHLEKDNTQLKVQVQHLLSKSAVQIQSIHTQTEFYQNELEQLSSKEDSQLNTGSIFYSDNDPTTNRDSTAKLDNIKLEKSDLRIDINSDLQQQHSGPNSNVKKSQAYLQGLTNSKLIDATKEGIPQKSNRIGEKNKQSDLKLYENFFIIGCDKKEFIEFDKDPTIKEGILPTSILYKSDQLNISVNEEIINGFVHPFGNQVEKIKINDSFEKLKEIIYSCNKYELLDKFSVFTIKNHDNTKDFIEYGNQKLMYQANPEKRLYGICLSVNDYVETTPDHIVSSLENRKKRIFWKYKKAYCFLTYFPFYELFQDLLISIIQLIKINRADRWIKNMSEENEVLKEIDGQQIILEFQDELTKFLNEIQAIRPMSGHQLLEVQTQASLLKYRIPNQLQLDIDLRLWSANITLQVLNYNEILTIFLAMISEISIIFACQNGSILTSIIHFFHHLIHPLEWTQGIIYNLPEQLLPMIQSPVPIIIGVNLPESDFKQMELTDHCENHLFVFLDRDQEDKFLHKPSNILEQISIPSFGGLLKQIETTLEDQNNMRTQSPSKRQSHKFDDKKVIKFYFDESDQNTSNIVLKGFKSIINDFAISKLPSYDEEGVQVLFEPQKQTEKSLDFQFIEHYLTYGNDPEDRGFIQKLFKTQYFQYFMQQHYEAQM